MRQSYNQCFFLFFFHWQKWTYNQCWWIPIGYLVQFLGTQIALPTHWKHWNQPRSTFQNKNWNQTLEPIFCQIQTKPQPQYTFLMQVPISSTHNFLWFPFKERTLANWFSCINKSLFTKRLLPLILCQSFQWNLIHFIGQLRAIFFLSENSFFSAACQVLTHS